MHPEFRDLRRSRVAPCTTEPALAGSVGVVYGQAPELQAIASLPDPPDAAFVPVLRPSPGKAARPCGTIGHGLQRETVNMALAEETAVALPGGSAVPARPKRHWFLALFGLPFAGTGIAVLVFALLPMFADAWRAQSWEEARWGLMALYLGMGLVFTGVGSSLVWFALRPRRRTERSAAQAEKPWLLRPEWAGPAVRSSAGTGLKVAWGFTVFWNLVAVPAGVASAFEFLEGNRPAAFGLLFPLVGAGLLAWAVRQTLAWRRFGHTSLVMDPYPGAIGGQVGGTIDVRLPYDPQLKFRTSLSCLYSHMSGSSKNRRRSERVVWQTNGVAFAVPRFEHTRLEILFDVDSGLPESDPKDESSYHLWRLHIEADLPGVDFDRSFELPVFPTGAPARELRRLSTEHRAAAEERTRAIDHVLDVHPIPGGIELHYPAFRHPAAKVLGFLFGSVFLGVGLLTEDAPIPMRLIFGAAGAGIALASLYNLLVSLRVRIDHAHLEIRRRLLGLPAGGASVPRGEISCLTLKQSYSSSSGGKHTVYFKLQALTSGGRSLKIGHNLPGRQTAREALEALSRVTGIPVEPGVEGNVLG